MHDIISLHVCTYNIHFPYLFFRSAYLPYSLSILYLPYMYMYTGDIGGKNIDYIPRRGFPGTLAPGELFKDNRYTTY